jgi:hypothetical protein
VVEVPRRRDSLDGPPDRSTERRSTRDRWPINGVEPAAASDRRLVPFLGPAFIAGVAYMDPGNFATNIEAGPGYGYTLLRVVLRSNPMAMPIQTLPANLVNRRATTAATIAVSGLIIARNVFLLWPLLLGG